MHLASALRAFYRYRVDVGTVQLNVVGAVVAHLFKFGYASDRVAASAVGAFPDVERSTPVTVTRDSPVLYILEPVAESSLADGFGYPVYGVVVLYEIFADCGHLDVP